MADQQEYEVVSKEGAALTKGLMDTWEKLGKPEDLSTNTGWIMMDAVVAVWHKFYPQEVLDWKHDRQIDLEQERSLKEHVKGGGYNPITYPPTLFQLMKAMFPDITLSDKKLQKKLMERYPLFKTTNYKV